ncbi:unnamed protein product [Sphagnum jensenii]|uniref:Alpha-D-phosphohexomutase C-terminal domain-containing protein n=1 Tax=Sphagnum jensenii TaxID=128206 RepID=A0ABP0XAW8_9BRYO
MVNQAVGDAFSGILMVEVVLHIRVKVKDRAVIITTADQTCVASPSSLQEGMDTEVGKYEGGRAFVRPSGMEDVVCMHAEASSQQSVDALAHAVCVQVYHLVGGISPEP